MDDTKKMLRAIINGQTAMKEELLVRMDKLDNRLTGRVDSLEEKVDKGFKKVNERIDKLGKSLAYLEDDTPTRDEFDKLKKRVSKVEKQAVSVT